jgi:putative transposase
MQGPKPPAIQLTERQMTVLQRITRRHSAPQRLVRRAQVVLLAAEGLPNAEISRQLGLARAGVSIWRCRWLAAGERLSAAEAADQADKQLLLTVEQLLADAARPGAPPTFSPEQVVQIVALSCEPPADSGRPISHWSARELAAEAQKRGIVKRISARSVGRFLK